MTTAKVGEALRQRRIEAGLTQRELARLSGVPQPNIAAYESGRRLPASPTAQRLDRALATPTLARIRAVRDAIIEAAESRRIANIRVFGSVARGEANVGSDLDLLVHPDSEASIFDLAGFMRDVEEIVDGRVDVVSDRGHGAALDRIRAEAIAL